MAWNRHGRSVRKHLLFICENRQEVSSLIPIANEIRELSCGLIQCSFASQDALYCQGVNEALQEAGMEVCLLPYPVRLSKPFAFNRMIQRFRVWVLLATNRQIAQVMQYYDGLVCGVDSTPARMLIAEARRLGKPSFQVIVSLYFGPDHLPLIDRYLKRAKYLLRSGLGLLLKTDFLALPNRIAGSGCDRIFVMGKRVKEALVRDGVPEKSVLVCGVPRFQRLFALSKARKILHQPRKTIDILYISGSYVSHGMSTQHKLQQRQIQEIIEYLSRSGLGRYRLIVKIHPRESKEYYTWLTKYPGLVRVVQGNTDPYKAILNSHVVVTICSTLSYEAILLNRPVIIAVFPSPELLSYRYLVNDFPVADSIQALMEYIAKISDDMSFYTSVVEDTLQRVWDVIDPKTPESASLIARQICTDMEIDYICRARPDFADS